MPDLKPFLVLGVALGGVFATSGVVLVVLYRTTGVLNLAYGAIGATGALISWSLLDAGAPEGLAYLACIAFGGAVTLVYGLVFGPQFAARDPLVKATATLGLLLILLGTMQWVWGPDPHGITLPTTRWNTEIAGARVSGTQMIGVLFAVAVAAATTVLLRVTKLGTAMRALADDREITATLGVPVRRVEAAAWFGSGLICGATGLLLSNLVGLEVVTLTFLVIPSLAAALVGQLRSVWITVAAGFLIGTIQSALNAFSEVADYRTLTPFVVAIIALLWFAIRRRPTTVQPFR
jgi:branched-chain amino acid transport system permease protein